MKTNCKVIEKPKGVKATLKSWYFWKPALSIIIGGSVGFLYHHFVGCSTGKCGITSNPYLSVLWGSALGYLLVNGRCSNC